mmetsp:Transcript_5044/g.18654  ORF Transcript_5044/g.18654 Transcript_5044/m.18654 type:complete len:318 (+) Transcript_5044:1510-2463(+)
MWHGNEDGVRRAELDLLGLTLPHRHGRDRLAGLDDLDRIEGGVAPVQQLLRLAGTRLAGGGAHHDGQQPPLAVGELAAGAGDQAVARGVIGAGLHPVHGGVAAQQQVAVVLADLVEGVVALPVVAVVLGEVRNDAGGNRGQIARAGLVAGLARAGDVLELGVLEAPGLGLAVHQLHEVLDRAGHAFGQRHGGVVGALDDETVQQLVDLGRHRGVDEHQRGGIALALVPGALGHGQSLVERELLVAQRAEDDVGRHQLGQRRGGLRHVGLALGQGLVRRQVDQHMAARGDLGRHRGLGMGRQRQGSQQRGEQSFHRIG